MFVDVKNQHKLKSATVSPLAAENRPFTFLRVHTHTHVHMRTRSYRDLPSLLYFSNWAVLPKKGESRLESDPQCVVDRANRRLK